MSGPQQQEQNLKRWVEGCDAFSHHDYASAYTKFSSTGIDVRSLYNTAVTLYKLGNNEDSLNVLHRVLSEDSKFALGLLLQGTIHFQMTDYGTAVEDFKTLSDLCSVANDGVLDYGCVGLPNCALRYFDVQVSLWCHHFSYFLRCWKKKKRRCHTLESHENRN